MREKRKKQLKKMKISYDLLSSLNNINNGNLIEKNVINFLILLLLMLFFFKYSLYISPSLKSSILLNFSKEKSIFISFSFLTFFYYCY